MWTKSQKISAGLLGVAALAFGVDRWVLSPSDSGSDVAAASEYALTPESRSQNSSTAPSSASTTPASTTQATTLAGRLSAMAVTRRYQYVATSDAFRASDDWLEQADKKAKAVNQAANGPASTTPEPAFRKSDPAADFAARHVLSAVMHSKTGGMAIVNGKLYETGRTIDGFKLVKVGATDATFTREGTTVTLLLPGQIPLASTD